jgi:hypothetical protein
MSEFGGKADVQQIHFIALVMITVLLGSANSRPLTQTKTATEAAAVINEFNAYALFLRAMPISPSRPEPNSHTAAGTGMADTCPLISPPGLAAV